MSLQHVKPHGALYNMMANDKKLGRAVVEAILKIDKNLILLALAESGIIDIALKLGLRVAREGFEDRAYNSDGTLVKRSIPGALITDPDLIAERVIKMIDQQKVETIDGEIIDLQIDTVCLHGDNKNALNVIKAIRKILLTKNVKIAPLYKFIN